MANAKVYVDGNLVATTNETGQYRLMNITTGNYKIQVGIHTQCVTFVDTNVRVYNVYAMSGEHENSEGV